PHPPLSFPTRRSSDLKTKNVLRATEILSLHNSAALELQSVGGGQTHKKQPHDDGSEKTLQVTHTSLSHPDSLKAGGLRVLPGGVDRKSTRLNSSHVSI